MGITTRDGDSGFQFLQLEASRACLRSAETIRELFASGGPRPGAGRPLGSKNKRKRHTQAAPRKAPRIEQNDTQRQHRKPLSASEATALRNAQRDKDLVELRKYLFSVEDSAKQMQEEIRKLKRQQHHWQELTEEEFSKKSVAEPRRETVEQIQRHLESVSLQMMAEGCLAQEPYARIRAMMSRVWDTVLGRTRALEISDNAGYDHNGQKGAGGQTNVTLRLKTVVGHENKGQPIQAHILAMWEGGDKCEKALAGLLRIKRELKQLREQGIAWPLQGGQRYSIGIYGAGDYKYLCEMAGHGGVSCKFPCIFCKLQKGDLEKEPVLQGDLRSYLDSCNAPMPGLKARLLPSSTAQAAPQIIGSSFWDTSWEYPLLDVLNDLLLMDPLHFGINQGGRYTIYHHLGK
ncbi:hypothetical protein WJX73_008397 [Symbiochloris irregularis]|uniref:Uncharacterized protein n=1 Tax=Symbiochloris irregularis TaxID=706552 RepID=A0AAW1NSL2_9CHLO